MIHQHEWRRHLPHVEKGGCRQFLTFVTHRRWVLPPAARQIALDRIVLMNRMDYDLVCAIVMPDYVHMIVQQRSPLSAVARRLKGSTARDINRLLGRRGRVWQEEYFDRVMRRSEDLLSKAEYVCANAVRAGLVSAIEDYPWVWRSWVEGGEMIHLASPIDSSRS